jgi:uncharacterized protein (UPF0147 family)
MFDSIIRYLEQSQQLIAAVVALALAAIAAYVAIKKALAEAMAKAKAQLVEAASPLIGQAETSPLSLLNELVSKPVLPPHADTNDGKNRIVSQALLEREPKLLKRLKLKTIVDVGQFVTRAYPAIFKPVIKSVLHKRG